MNDDDIQFGEVEEAAPEGALRPDRNKHFAVAEYGSPGKDDLPIFVDLDVLLDMEEHALSDMSVELGGVLLGGCHEDDAGRPFVVITDSLRAQHYESTKGSFKFTHDTWSAITRERDQFPPELAMVGWYHTHPDWGVFLSGMDMFICDNFFNKRLDVAYVIDPCRGDRGMFQWTGDPRQRVRRTGGFFVTASRFRAAELEHLVAELSGTMPATTSRPATGSYSGAPVVHLHQPPPSPPPAWQAPVVMGMLCLQFCLLALIAWRMVDPLAGSSARSAAEAGEVKELKEALAARAEAEAALAKVKFHTEVLDQLSSELKGTGPGFVERMQERFDQTQKYASDVTARDAQIRELQTSVADADKRLRVAEAKASTEQDRLKARLDELDKQVASLTKSNDDLTASLKKYEPAPKIAAAAGADKPTDERSVWWYVGGGVLAAVLLVAGVWWGGMLWTDKETSKAVEEEQAREASPEPPVKDE